MSVQKFVVVKQWNRIAIFSYAAATVVSLALWAAAISAVEHLIHL